MSGEKQQSALPSDKGGLIPDENVPVDMEDEDDEFYKDVFSAEETEEMIRRFDERHARLDAAMKKGHAEYEREWDRLEQEHQEERKKAQARSNFFKERQARLDAALKQSRDEYRREWERIDQEWQQAQGGAESPP